MKREEIFQYVKEQYGTEPEYLWKKDPDSAVLRHKNGKYGHCGILPKKKFGKPSIATEKLFCNSKGVHSRSRQCLRIYKDHFALQNACWEIPNP